MRVSDRMTIDSEFSSGDLGPGGKMGTNYIHSEQTSLYLNYRARERARRARR